MIEADSAKFSAATQLFTKLRFGIGRTIDVVWMLKDPVYAQEVLRLARAANDPDINQVVDRFEAAMAVPVALPVATSPPVTLNQSDEEEISAHYIGHLR